MDEDDRWERTLTFRFHEDAGEAHDAVLEGHVLGTIGEAQHAAGQDSATGKRWDEEGRKCPRSQPRALEHIGSWKKEGIGPELHMRWTVSPEGWNRGANCEHRLLAFGNVLDRGSVDGGSDLRVRRLARSR